MAKGQFLIKDGHRLAVIRPEDPRKALELVAEWRAKCAGGEYENAEAEQQAFAEILTAQIYRYVGLLDVKGRLLDEGGWHIGRTKAGDSFIPEYQAKAAVVTAKA